MTRPFLQRLGRPEPQLGNHNARPSPVTALFIFPNSGRQAGQRGTDQPQGDLHRHTKGEVWKNGSPRSHSSSLKHQTYGNGYLNNSPPLLCGRVPAACRPASPPPSHWPARYWRKVRGACGPGTALCLPGEVRQPPPPGGQKGQVTGQGCFSPSPISGSHRLKTD